METKIPTKDLDTAIEIGPEFYVSFRESRKDRWEQLLESVSLEEAFKNACQLSGSGLAAIGIRGLRYWDSVEADIFNSEVLELVVQGYV